MPTITVTAPDSSLAMDEIMRRLGDGAFILSTRSQDGQVVIRATNDPLPARNEKAEKPEKSSFGELFSKVGTPEEHVILHRPRENPPAQPTAAKQLAPVIGTPVLTGSGEDDVASDHAAGLENLEIALPGSDPDVTDHRHETSSKEFLESLFARIREFDAGREARNTDLRRRLEGAVASVAAARAAAEFAETEARTLEAERDGLKADVRELKAALVAAEEANRRVAEANELVALGFRADLVGRLTAKASGNRHLDFATGLAREIVAAQSQVTSLIDGDGLAIVGPTGSGKSHLAAKFAALMRVAAPEKPVKLISVPYQFDNITLSSLALQMGIDHAYMEAEDLSDPTRFDTGTRFIIDINLAKDLIPDLRLNDPENDKLPVLVAMPAGQSPGRIEQTLGHYQEIASQIVLTKLDEYECDAAELCAYATSRLPIGWLSGTQEIEGTLKEASVDVFRDYVIEMLGEPETTELSPPLAAE